MALSGVTVLHRFTSYFDIMHQGESNTGLVQKVDTKAAAVLKMREVGGTPGSLELCYEIPLLDVVYARVRGTSSPSFREPVHLSAFFFASFPNAYESTI